MVSRNGHLVRSFVFRDQPWLVCLPETFEMPTKALELELEARSRTVEAFSRRGETFSQVSEYYLTGLQASSSDFGDLRSGFGDSSLDFGGLGSGFGDLLGFWL